MNLRLSALLLSGAALLTACIEPVPSNPSTQTPKSVTSQAAGEARFTRVVSRMEQIAEQQCRALVASNVNCDFAILLDDDPNKGSNAYQTLDRNGRPILAFTAQILTEFQNDDELAFVLGHEAAHHIEGHITETQTTAVAGALAGGLLAAVLGGGQAAVDIGSNLGGSAGARAYSKDHELEADRLGAIITERAGYDALRGAAFFERIPDPGDRFLGSHPPNGQRIQVVKETVAGL